MKNKSLIVTMISIAVVMGVILLCCINSSMKDKPLLYSNGEPMITHDDELYKIEEVARIYRESFNNNGQMNFDEYRKYGIYNATELYDYLLYSQEYLMQNYGDSREWDSKYKYLYTCMFYMTKNFSTFMQIWYYTGGNLSYTKQEDSKKFKDTVYEIQFYYDHYIIVKNN